MTDWLSLIVPFAYIGILLGSLATFSSLYRKRKARKALSLEPWFPPHLQRDIYFSLLHLDPSPTTRDTNGGGSNGNSSHKKGIPVPDSVLKAALLRRATEDINRVLTLRGQKQALTVLLQRGSVSDDLWQRFQRAEKEMEDEVRDVVAEANAYVPNWGQIIFQSANEMMNNGLVRKIIEEHREKLSEEREWWDQKKARIQEGFMKELDAERPGRIAASSAAAKDDALNQRSSPSSIPASDDDAVMVEADGPPAESNAGAGGGGGGKKKKKGKK